MSEPTMETLARRLDRLERENRRLKRAGVVILGVIAAVVLMGQATPRKVAKVIEAEKFVLRDAVGTIRAVLGPGELGGLYHLTLFDMNGKELVGLATALDQAVLLFNDSHRKTRAAISVVRGASTLTLYDDTGTPRAEMGAQPDGRPRLTLWDRDGKVIWSAP